MAISLGKVEGLLCHGIVYHDKSGWHEHCWIEQGETVQDFANGHNAVLPKELYYTLGNVKDVVRYTMQEAQAVIVKMKTYGPWLNQKGETNETQMP